MDALASVGCGGLGGFSPGVASAPTHSLPGPCPGGSAGRAYPDPPWSRLPGSGYAPAPHARPIGVESAPSSQAGRLRAGADSGCPSWVTPPFPQPVHQATSSGAGMIPGCPATAPAVDALASVGCVGLWRPFPQASPAPPTESPRALPWGSVGPSGPRSWGAHAP